MPPDTDPNAPVPASDAPAPDQTAVNTKILDALTTITSRLASLPAADQPAATAATAAAAGLDPNDLIRAVNEAVAAGNPGEGVLKAMAPVLGAMNTDQMNREGRREIESIATHPDLGVAFREHGNAFKRFLTANGIAHSRLAEPGIATRAFDDFLRTNTDWHSKQQAEREEKLRKETRAQVEAELSARRPAPASATSLSGTPRTEGGALRRLVDNATSGATEATPDQTDIMQRFGFDETKQKSAMAAHSKKTMLGTPLDFVPTRNEGAV